MHFKALVFQAYRTQNIPTSKEHKDSAKGHLGGLLVDPEP